MESSKIHQLNMTSIEKLFFKYLLPIPIYAHPPTPTPIPLPCLPLEQDRRPAKRCADAGSRHLSQLPQMRARTAGCPVSGWLGGRGGPGAGGIDPMAQTLNRPCTPKPPRSPSPPHALKAGRFIRWCRGRNR